MAEYTASRVFLESILQQGELPIELYLTEHKTMHSRQTYVGGITGKVGEHNVYLEGKVGFELRDSQGKHQATTESFSGNISGSIPIYLYVNDNPNFTGKKLDGRIGNLDARLACTEGYDPVTRQNFICSITGTMKAKQLKSNLTLELFSDPEDSPVLGQGFARKYEGRVFLGK